MPGPSEARLAIVRTTTVTIGIAGRDTDGAETRPILSTILVHTVRPTMMPSGTPMTRAQIAHVEACHATVATTCRRVNPIVFKTPI